MRGCAGVLAVCLFLVNGAFFGIMHWSGVFPEGSGLIEQLLMPEMLVCFVGLNTGLVIFALVVIWDVRREQRRKRK